MSRDAFSHNVYVTQGWGLDELQETNAMALLDMYAQIMPIAIEDSLDEIRALFNHYINYPDSISQERAPVSLP